MEDQSERLARLYDELDSFAQQVESAGTRAGVFTGRDDTGAVTVNVEDGQVRDAAVSHDWRRHVAACDLAAAVEDAVNAATVAALEQWGDALAGQHELPAPRSRPMPPMSESFAFRLDDAIAGTADGRQGETALRELLAMAETLERGIDEASAQLDARLNATYTGRSQSGHVTAVITAAGEVVAVTIDQRWLANAHEYNIGRETSQAFRAAYEQRGSINMPGGAVDGDITAHTPLEELAELGRDPVEVVRRLGLR